MADEETVHDAYEYGGLTYVIWKGESPRELSRVEQEYLTQVGRLMGRPGAPRVVTRRERRFFRELVRKLSWSGIRVIGLTAEVRALADRQALR